MIAMEVWSHWSPLELFFGLAITAIVIATSAYSIYESTSRTPSRMPLSVDFLTGYNRHLHGEYDLFFEDASYREEGHVWYDRGSGERCDPSTEARLRQIKNELEAERIEA